MLIFLTVCLILSQKCFLRFYPEWLRVWMFKVIDFRSLYFKRLKSRSHVLVHSRNETQTRTAFNFLSKKL
jgi:hypothetical protein